jgi:methyl-accepting chemotaxis protein
MSSIRSAIANGFLRLASTLGGANAPSGTGAAPPTAAAAPIEAARHVDAQNQLAAIERSFAVAEFTSEGTVLRANDNFCRAVGYTASEILGRQHSLFVEPAQRESADYRDFWRRLKEGEAVQGLFGRVGKSGRRVWLRSFYVAVNGVDGKPAKILEYATDVTEETEFAHEFQLASRETQRVCQQSIAGNLVMRIATDGMSSEIKQMVTDVNAVLNARCVLIGRIKNLTVSVLSASEEIAKGNDSLSRITESQAASLEETSSSMEQMTATVKQTAENAGRASEFAVIARQRAESGGEVVGSAVTAMRQINESSRKIADIIGVIDEIAFQTNLLALNAAVEAARAGEEGRGFAVVASEVRNLAGRSAAAAKEIKSLIQDSVNKVQDGSRLVDASGKTLSDIVSAVKTVTDIVAEIAVSSREQAAGIEQVNKAVLQLDGGTQQNAALVEQTASASQQILEQIEALHKTVAKYQVEDEARVANRGRNAA